MIFFEQIFLLLGKVTTSNSWLDFSFSLALASVAYNITAEIRGRQFCGTPKSDEMHTLISFYCRELPFVKLRATDNNVASHLLKVR